MWICVVAMLVDVQLKMRKTPAFPRPHAWRGSLLSVGKLSGPGLRPRTLQPTLDARHALHRLGKLWSGGQIEPIAYYCLKHLAKCRIPSLSSRPSTFPSSLTTSVPLVLEATESHDSHPLSAPWFHLSCTLPSISSKRCNGAHPPRQAARLCTLNTSTSTRIAISHAGSRARTLGFCCSHDRATRA